MVQETSGRPFPQATRNGRPLRVLMLTDYFPKPTIPELGVWALTQAKAMAALGAEVRVISPTSWIPPLLRNLKKARRFAACPPAYQYDAIGVSYPRWLFYSAGPVQRLWFGRPSLACRLAWWTLRRQVKRELQQWRPDVVFAHHTIPCGMMALRIKQKYGLPYVVQDHDFGSVESCFAMPGRRRAFERVAHDAWAMASVSKRMSEMMSRLVPGVRALPLYIGTHGPGEELRRTPRPPELQDKLVVFSAALFYQRKAVPLLVRAFATVAARHPRAILRIAGDGQERPAVEAAIAQTHLTDRVQLLGMLGHERVLQEMLWCDLFMLIGYEEPLGLVYLEAMSAGKPIICCNDGGLCDLLEDGVQGRTVPPRDVPAAAAALEQLLGDEPFRLKLAAGASALYQTRLTSEATAGATLAVLNQAAASTGSR